MQALMMIERGMALGKVDPVRGDTRWKDVNSMERAVCVDFVRISAV